MNEIRARSQWKH